MIEPGPELEARLARIEQRVLAASERSGTPVVLSMSAKDVLMLVACIRQLIRDRDFLLEEVEALEAGAGPP